jgi:hypothetical protein
LTAWPAAADRDFNITGKGGIMQIDFHHAVTYVAARGAGFSPQDAEVIAYAAQYVDDAVCDGTVCFSTGAAYTRISSAHKTVDPHNMDDISNHLVWLPFHFLPGNGGKKSDQEVEGTFIDKIVCRPDSEVAKDVLELTLQARGKANALHRLGVTMHVYADTWAHQGFAGVLHDINEVDDAQEIGKEGIFSGNLGEVVTGWIAERFVPALGHGRAQVLPDMPFLKWQYKDGRGTPIERDNTDLFCRAADEMCKFMQRFRDAPATGLPPGDLGKIRTLFTTWTDIDGGKRHGKWIAAIASGVFSFGPATISYDDTGRGSWKAKALRTAQDLPVHQYDPSFLTSDWKKFHDAVQQHRLALLHDVLPQYGICAA